MKKLIGMLGLLAMILILGGCRLLEEHRANQKLDYYAEVYPTKSVSDLFDKFPNGFILRHSERETVGETSYRHELKLDGHPETKELTGWYTKESYAPEEVLLSIPVRYSDREGLVATDGQELGDFIKSRKFLFTQLSFKKSDRKGLVYNSTFTNPMSENEKLYYKIHEEKLQSYLQVDEVFNLNIYTYKKNIKKGKFIMTIIIDSRDSEKHIGESIEEK